MSDPIEVRAFSLIERVFIATIWVALAAFCYWLTWTRTLGNQWMGYAVGALFFYAALYWMRAPAVLVRADDTGMTYADMRLGVFLVFGEGRAAWTDILGVDTRQQSSRYGTFLRTRVTVRAEGGAGKRRFSVTSRAVGYLAFLEALHAHTSGSAAAMQGLGDDPARAETALHGIAARRTTMLIVLLAVLGAMFALIAALRR